MNTPRFSILILVAVAFLPGCICSSKQPMAAKAGEDVLARFSALDGDWTADSGSPDLPPSTVSYRTIANGSAVVETVFVDTPSEMVTVIFRDGDRLLMTHYCAARNQPHLYASSITDDRIAFVTDHVTNHEDPKALYMGAVTWTFVDDDHMSTKWWTFENGKRGEAHVFNLTRVVE